jgi:hypothetical protein
MFKRVLLSLIFVLMLSIPAFAQQTFPAPYTGWYTQGNGGSLTYFTVGDNMSNNGWKFVASGANGNGGSVSQKQKQKQSQIQFQNQSQNQSTNVGNGINNFSPSSRSTSDSESNAVALSVTEIKSEEQREFAVPGTVIYPYMPQEHGNTSYANVQPVEGILQWGCAYNKVHLTNMKGDGRVKTLQSSNLYGNTVKPSDTDTITFLLAVPADMKLKKVGSVVKKAKSGNTTTEQVLGDMGLEALTIKGAKYVLVSAQGHQSKTSTSGWGVALGYTHAGISDNQQWSGTGTAGIGYSSGEAGRETSPYLHGTVLTDEATLEALLKEEKPNWLQRMFSW